MTARRSYVAFWAMTCKWSTVGCGSVLNKLKKHIALLCDMVQFLPEPSTKRQCKKSSFWGIAFLALTTFWQSAIDIYLTVEQTLIKSSTAWYRSTQYIKSGTAWYLYYTVHLSVTWHLSHQFAHQFDLYKHYDDLEFTLSAKCQKHSNSLCYCLTVIHFSIPFSDSLNIKAISAIPVSKERRKAGSPQFILCRLHQRAMSRSAVLRSC